MSEPKSRADSINHSTVPMALMTEQDLAELIALAEVSQHANNTGASAREMQNSKQQGRRSLEGQTTGAHSNVQCLSLSWHGSLGFASQGRAYYLSLQVIAKLHQALMH